MEEKISTETALAGLQAKKELRRFGSLWLSLSWRKDALVRVELPATMPESLLPEDYFAALTFLAKAPLHVPMERSGHWLAGFRSALRSVPAGNTITYGTLAAQLGCPRGARAVARCCATNPLLLVIPCHRVIPARGGVGGYSAGPEWKAQLLRIEAATAPPPQS
ncbi:MAG: methylated-DNA--[protein]-cysteine S-methyltransferase [Verrucomicrobiales bacterium]